MVLIRIQLAFLSTESQLVNPKDMGGDSGPTGGSTGGTFHPPLIKKALWF